MRTLAIALAVAAYISSIASADEPKKDTAPKDEPPPPRVVMAPPGNLFLPPHAFQYGTRDVWQNYRVDSFGRWRPRVVLSPAMPYYYSDGRPYPWASTHPGSFLPAIRD